MIDDINFVPCPYCKKAIHIADTLHVLNCMKNGYDKDYAANFVFRPPENAESEYGSSEPIRFILNGSEPKTIERCIDCEAQSHIFKLHDIACDGYMNFNILREALLFILENTDWPVGDGKE